MITEKELDEVQLSPTKKDYYQIWNEIIELASRLSTVWQPEQTNESDPGIILLKVLTAVADKLNYNIDKNILEAFMPSASQQESMRKLTSMMGYTMKYYQAATTEVSISYKDSNEHSLNEFDKGIFFPKFINIKNEEETVNYVTLEDFILSEDTDRAIPVIEGELIECASDTDNIISMTQLDDNFRFYLPETAIAENGIFVSNIEDTIESGEWLQVSNLNTQLPKALVYKFDYDSLRNLPYIQFPSDIAHLIGDGLKIKYIRTNGYNGNISARVLCKLEAPSIWKTADETSLIYSLAAEDFTVVNASAAKNGADPETLDEAYNGYKKTIGTFDTLVTCRDYMNKIYQLTRSQYDTTPLVSNVIVSDIRDDINKSAILCTFNEYGIRYNNVSLKDENGENKINHFDLCIYPFKTVYGLDTKAEYKGSFTRDTSTVAEIEDKLKYYKTIAHEYNYQLADNDIVAIKNYLQLQAKVTTTRKVTLAEEKEILNNIYTAIYHNFNMRKLDFSEEIPYDTILKVIETADTRIKDINLNEPVLLTYFLTKDGTEEIPLVAAAGGAYNNTCDRIYNRLALRNVLAGRIAAYSYDLDFKAAYTDTAYGHGIDTSFPTSSSQQVAKLTSELILTNGTDYEYALKENEVIQFKLPNLKTIITYPAYVNYYIKLDTAQSASNKGYPATMQTLQAFLAKPGLNSGKYATFIPTVLGVSADDPAYETWKEHLATGALTVTERETLWGALGAIHTWVASIWTEKGKGTAEYKEYTDVYCKLAGLYKTKGVTTTNVSGYLVDEQLYRYTDLTTKTSGSPLTDIYIPLTHDIDEIAYEQTGLGKDGVYQGLGVDAEYTLGPTEYLWINYTNSDKDAAGNEVKSVKTVYHGPGTIIKPNFDLIDSATYHATHSYTKKVDGLVFTATDSIGQAPEGMFTLGSNEQICIRDFVTITLDDNKCNIYWDLQTDDSSNASNEFIWDEEPMTYVDGTGTKTAYMAHTLKQNEYFYYTNSKKTDLAYYGEGTTIKRYYPKLTLVKPTSGTEIASEDIISSGVASAINWVSRNLDGTSPITDMTSGSPVTTNYANKIDICENQFLTLTEGDILVCAVDHGEIAQTTTGINFASAIVPVTGGSTASAGICNIWRACTGASYKLAESSTDEVMFLPTVSLGNVSWQVRSRLDFNMSPSNPQILKTSTTATTGIDVEGNTVPTVAIQAIDRIQVTYDTIANSGTVTTNTKNFEAQGSADYADLALYTNYTCQLATDHLDFKMKDPDDSTQYIYTGLKLKTGLQTSVPMKAGSVTLNDISFGNYDSWTKVNFAEFIPATYSEAEIAALAPMTFRLNMSIPSTDKFGLIMFYYVDSNQESTEGNTNKIQLTSYNAASLVGGGIGQYNIAPDYFNSAKQPQTTTILLHPGINIIMVHRNTTSIEVRADSKNQAILVFSDLDLIAGINEKLDYRVMYTANGETAVSGSTGNVTDAPEGDISASTSETGEYTITVELDATSGDSFAYQVDAGAAARRTVTSGYADAQLRQLEYDIRATGIADTFYYNAMIDSATDIDINPYIEEELLSSPNIWYDQNNINSKFVISEIDADYLPTGITLTKASRR